MLKELEGNNLVVPLNTAEDVEVSKEVDAKNNIISGSSVEKDLGSKNSSNNESEVDIGEEILNVIKGLNIEKTYTEVGGYSDKADTLSRDNSNNSSKSKSSSNPILSLFFMQIGILVSILFILKVLLEKFIFINRDLIVSCYKPNLVLRGNTLVVCKGISDFINTAVESILNLNMRSACSHIYLGITLLVIVLSSFIVYRAFKIRGNEFLKCIQIVVSAMFIVVASYMLLNYAKRSVIFMNEDNLINYFDSMSDDDIETLAMESNGVTIKLNYDGTVEGVYKVNKEKLLETLIDGSSDWGVDFELPKEVEIMDALFELESVSDSEFIYELP